MWFSTSYLLSNLIYYKWLIIWNRCSSFIEIFNIQIVLLFEIRTIWGSKLRYTINLYPKIFGLALRTNSQWNHPNINSRGNIRSLKKLNRNWVTEIITIFVRSLLRSTFLISAWWLIVTHTLSHCILLFDYSLWIWQEWIQWVLEMRNKCRICIFTCGHIVGHPLIIFYTIKIWCFDNRTLLTIHSFDFLIWNRCVLLKNIVAIFQEKWQSFLSFASKKNSRNFILTIARLL